MPRPPIILTGPGNRFCNSPEEIQDKEHQTRQDNTNVANSRPAQAAQRNTASVAMQTSPQPQKLHISGNNLRLELNAFLNGGTWVLPGRTLPDAGVQQPAQSLLPEPDAQTASVGTQTSLPWPQTRTIHISGNNVRLELNAFLNGDTWIFPRRMLPDAGVQQPAQPRMQALEPPASNNDPVPSLKQAEATPRIREQHVDPCGQVHDPGAALQSTQGQRAAPIPGPSQSAQRNHAVRPLQEPHPISAAAAAAAAAVADPKQTTAPAPPTPAAQPTKAQIFRLAHTMSRNTPMPKRDELAQLFIDSPTNRALETPLKASPAAFRRLYQAVAREFIIHTATLGVKVSLQWKLLRLKLRTLVAHLDTLFCRSSTGPGDEGLWRAECIELDEVLAEGKGELRRHLAFGMGVRNLRVSEQYWEFRAWFLEAADEAVERKEGEAREVFGDEAEGGAGLREDGVG